MFSRVLAAACATALGAAVLTAPVQTAARGGGGGGHFGGFGVRPFHPIVRPVHPLVSRPFAVNRFFFARTHFLRHRGSNGGVSYGDWGSAPYGSYYDPSAVGALPAAYPPLYPPGPPPQPVDHVGCRSRTVTVPAAGGGESKVTITRC
jgi:hypothetical protein